APQPEFDLDLAALGLGALAVALVARAPAVLAHAGGHDVDVVLGVPYRDPPAARIVAMRGDASGVDDAAGDLRPFGVGEVAVAGGCADRTVPYVLRHLLPGALPAELDRLV